MTLSFLDAHKIAAKQNSFKTLDFVLAASCQTEKLEPFIKGCCIQKGFNCTYTVLPFNTLSQYVYQHNQAQTHHVFFLSPWDLVPQADWRTGISSTSFDYQQTINHAQKFMQQVSAFKSARVIYLAAPIPPLSRNNSSLVRLEQELRLLILSHAATILSGDNFSLTGYLTTGCPVAGTRLFDVADIISSNCCPGNHETKKILVTDFDNVMWKGVVGEDGLEGIKCEPDGAGYVHYIYQTFLDKLKQEGVLIAAVTRNDEELANSPFNNGLTFFKKENFVAIIASYNAKSSQIEKLSATLNLPLDSFVFVDDNPIEIEEVSKQLPDVTCITFPPKTENFPEFIQNVARCFHEHQLTEDDYSRTEMYKARGKVSVVTEKKGADLTEYLTSLDMSASYTQCTKNNFHRALQLINKTNQFNLNGNRLKENELLTILDRENTTLVSISLKDKFGDHGQVCCFLVQKTNHISHFVMSCRVFQRKLEFTALLILFEILQVDELSLDYSKTDRNIPMQMFLSESSDSTKINSELLIDRHKFETLYGDCLNLFSITPKTSE